MITEDLMQWLQKGQLIEVSSQRGNYRGTILDFGRELLVLQDRKGNTLMIRYDMIDSVIHFSNKGMTLSIEAANRKRLNHQSNTEESFSESGEPRRQSTPLSDALLRQESATVIPADKISVKEDGSYNVKPGDRLPLSLLESSTKHPRFRQNTPMNAVEKPTIEEIIDEMDEAIDPDTIPTEDTLVVRAQGIIKKRDNLKKFGFIEAYDEEKTNYWFPFTALTDEDLSFQDEVFFFKTSNDKGHVAHGIARPDTIHRILLLVDYISENRYYNFPVTIPLLQAVLEQYPDNKHVKEKLAEQMEKRDNHNNRTRL